MSQNTLVFQRSNPLQSLAGMARTIALPHEFAPQRFPSFPALERTAVIGFTQPYQWDPPSTTSVNRVMLSRQAAYPFWVDRQISATSPLLYGVSGVMDTAGVPTTMSAGSGGVVGCADLRSYYVGANSGAWPAACDATWPGFVLAAGTPAPFTWPVMGRSDDSENTSYIYAPKGSTIWTVVTHSASLPAGGATEIKSSINYDVATAGGEVVLQTASDPILIAVGMSSYTSWVAPSNMWVRTKSIVSLELTAGTFYPTSVYYYTGVFTGTVGFVPVLNKQVQLTFTPAAMTCFLPFKTVPEFTTSILPYCATRLTACAVLLTNVTPVLNKAGTFLGGRVNPRVADPFNLSEDTLAALHPAEKAFLNAETGFYTFCPPSTDLANFFDYTDSTLNVPLYRLDNDALSNVIFFRDNLAANLAVTVDWHLEFRNSSALFQVGMSGATLETLHQAQLTLATLGYFFSNDAHKYTIGHIIASVGKKALDYVPYGGYLKKALNTQITLGHKSQSSPAATHAVPTAVSQGAKKKKKRKDAAPYPMNHPRPKMKSGLGMYLASKKRGKK